MKEIALDEILAAAHDAEFSRFDNSSEHIFSRKHNRAMKRIFKIYEKRTAPLRQNVIHTESTKTQFRWNRKTAAVMLIIIFLAALAGCAMAVFHFGGFRAEPHSDNTQLFPINFEGCPQYIEEEYYLPQIPEGFELFDRSVSNFTIYTAYMNSETKQTISFCQSVKKAFAPHYDTENSTLEQISINEHEGVGLDWTIGYIAAWDNGDYILEVAGDLSKSEVINLAKSAKLLKN